MNPKINPLHLFQPLATRRRLRVRSGNALLLAVIWIALFALIVSAVYTLSSETARRSTRENRFTGVQTAADAALDVLYGRFSRWVDAHTGLTPSIADTTRTGVPGDSAFPAVAGAIDFSNTPGLSDYRVTNISVVPLMPDDSQGTDFPDWTAWGTNPTSYQARVNKYYINLPNLYDPGNFSNALTYLATVTVTPTTIDALHPGAITVKRYFQKSEVSPFSYNIFTVGAFEDFDWGQSFDSQASIYASVSIKLDHPGTIINGPMRYGDSFVDPTGVSGGVNRLVFQDPNTGQTVDPYGSGLLRQVSKIEIVPDLANVIAHSTDASGNVSRSAATEFTAATADKFSRREVIEPPANLANDTAPDQIKQRRIYTQADVRMRVNTFVSTTIKGTVTTQTTLAKATFFNLDGSTKAEFIGTPSGTGATTWKHNGGGTNDPVAASILDAVNVNTVDSAAPFFDPSRRYDSASIYDGQAGQPTAVNSGHAIETVDINVGVLKDVINSNKSSTFANNTIYIWNDGVSGEKNGVRLYNGGILPDDGLTVGTTNPIYVKGDYNTGSILSSPTDINASTTSTQPAANTMGWNGGNMASYDDRHVPGYTPRPAGIFGDTLTTLSQNWKDSASGSSTQYARSTTFNAVLGFGSGDVDSLRKDDTFASGQYANVQVLESWNNCRWNQLGEQMALYHSIYSRQNPAPTWVTPGYQWFVQQNDFDAKTARLPLKWGYLVFSRGRYSRS